jgi:hypothetical protein
MEGRANFYDEAVETIDREKLHGLQEQKLTELIDTIWGRNLFYTAKLKAAGFEPADRKLLDQLDRLPFTTKSELMAAQDEGGFLSTNCTFPEEAYTRIHQTSGFTTRPPAGTGGRDAGASCSPAPASQPATVSSFRSRSAPSSDSGRPSGERTRSAPS